MDYVCYIMAIIGLHLLYQGYIWITFVISGLYLDYICYIRAIFGLQLLYQGYSLLQLDLVSNDSVIYHDSMNLTLVTGCLEASSQLSTSQSEAK